MTIAQTPIETPDNPRVREITGPLRESAVTIAAADPQRAAALMGAVEEVERKLRLVLSEHEGMAVELLRVYEQLGIVFDVTRKLLTLHTEEEVAMFFVECLRASYADLCFAVVREVDGRRSVSGDVDVLPKWIHSAVDTARDTRSVAVEHSGEVVGTAADGATLYSEEALVTAVFAGDSFSCAIVLRRRSDDGGAAPWTSGDMLLFGSLGSFCGDAIRNFRLVQELRDASMDTVRTLVTAVDQKDPYTSGHSNRVGYYAKLLATELGFDAEQLRTLEWSALLHDVGKIGIRDDVLKKCGRLTRAEFEHIKEHPVRGYDVLRHNPHMHGLLDGVLHHHERYDGKGYPGGLRGEGIPLQARIIQIADIFDALTTTRSYREAFSWQKAVEILETESGTVVDPRLSELFVAMLSRLYAENPDAFNVIGRTEASLRLTDKMEPSHGATAPCS